MSERRNTFKDGADFYAKEIGAFVGGEHTRLANADYLKNVQQEIDNLSEAINKYADNGNPQLKPKSVIRISLCRTAKRNPNDRFGFKRFLCITVLSMFS